MRKNCIKKAISYIFAENENFTLENRLLLSSTLVGLLINIFAAIVNSILTTSIIAVTIPLILGVFVFILYCFVRFREVGEIVPTITVVISIIGVSAIWVFNGGINGGNIMPAFVVLILGLLVVPPKIKKYIIVLFISANIFILLIQLYRPDIIVQYPTETDRWIDTLISLIYSSYFIYLIITFIHKHYSIEKKRAEENEKKFKILYDNSPDMYLSVSALDAKIVRCNATFYKNSGYSKEEIIGKSIFQLYHDDCIEDAKQAFKLFAETGNIKNKQLVAKRKDGSNISISLSADAVRDENQKIIYSISTWRDITEQKRAEQIIIQQNIELSKLNLDKDRFLSILAHDLRSPFNMLLGLSDLLLKNLDNYNAIKIEELLTLINMVSHQTFNLLEDLLLWSKSQSGKISFNPIKIDFNKICAEILSELSYQAEAKKIFINSLNSEKIILLADLNLLKTILRNLISNAIKFTNKNGQINVFAVKTESNAIITISDNGIGIEKENQNKLWDFSLPYTTPGTDSEKGTGLGLLLCKEFVEKHKGKIWVESELGRGSDFKFTIPLFND